MKRAAQFLAAKGSQSPRLDAELLVGHALGMTRLQLYLDRDRPLNDDELARARELVRRRAAHEPVAYITGKKEFFGYEFIVTPAVLVPRPETELLVEHAVAELDRRFGEQETLRVLEFGTGSGAIAVTLALLQPNLRIVATEISAEAAEVARENASRHNVADRVDIRVQSDFSGIEGPFHAVVSNPPYVAEKDAATLPPDVLNYEPHAALFAGPDGMKWITWLFAVTPPLLHPGGFLAMEIGQGMAEQVGAAARAHGWTVEAVLRDYADIERIVRCGRG